MFKQPFKLNKIYFIFFFIIIFNNISIANENNKHKIILKYYDSIYDYVITINGSDILSTPSWNPIGENQPPVELYKAIDLAEKNFSKYSEQPKNYKITKISLRRFKESKKWYYTITYDVDKPFFYKSEKPINQIVVPVLMSGTTPLPNSKVKSGKQHKPIILNSPSSKSSQQIMIWGSSTAGGDIEFILSSEHITSLGEWDPEKGEAIPLSYFDAVNLANQKLADYREDINKMYVSEIELINLRGSNKWFYRVNFKHKKQITIESKYPENPLKIPVIFSGTVIDGR